jgi:hypothetical protein
MKSWCALAVMAGLAGVMGRAQAPDVVLSRPGQITVTAVTGEAKLTLAGQTRPVKVDDRVRADAQVATGRRSLVSLLFSNGATLELGTESEIEIEELLQAPFTAAGKPETYKVEPSVSRTRVRVIRGDVRVGVKPLQVARGSTFVVGLPAGNVRVAEGAIYALVRMTEAGIGFCAIEHDRGAAEFEPAGGIWAKLPVGRRLELAVEVDRRTGEAKVIPMPEAGAPAKK